MTVSSTTLPPHSALLKYVAPKDFLDCYVVASTMSARKAAEIVVTFPSWARALVRLRNLVIKPFGIAPDGPPAKDKIGFFPVEHSSENEIIAGFDDKHLNFRVSVLSDNGNIYLATWVHRHNIGGRIYLMLIMPFHILISRNALARVAKG